MGMDREKDEIVQEAENLCNKFINKVRTGRARSRETYADCLHLSERIKRWRNESEKS
jgi:hypothetical protein